MKELYFRRFKLYH